MRATMCPVCRNVTGSGALRACVAPSETPLPLTPAQRVELVNAVAVMAYGLSDLPADGTQ